jgi:ATP-dependent Clp protease adapter protein ClpS
MAIWHDILVSINMLSQDLQEKVLLIDDTIKHIEVVISFFQKFGDENAKATTSYMLAVELFIVH